MKKCSWGRAGCQSFRDSKRGQWGRWVGEKLDGDSGISHGPSLVTLGTNWEAFGSNPLYWFCAQCGNDYCVCAAAAKHAKLFYQRLLVLIFSTITFGHCSPNRERSPNPPWHFEMILLTHFLSDWQAQSLNYEIQINPRLCVLCHFLSGSRETSPNYPLAYFFFFPLTD